LVSKMEKETFLEALDEALERGKALRLPRVESIAVSTLTMGEWKI